MVGGRIPRLDVMPSVFSIGIAAGLSLCLYVCDVAFRSPADQTALHAVAPFMGLAADPVEPVDGLAY